MVNTPRQWLKALGIGALVFIALFAASFLFPATNEICEYSEHTKHEECALYHAGPFVLQTIAIALSGYADLIIALGTVAIGAFTWTLWQATERSGEHFRVTERAYIKISHDPPGLIWNGKTIVINIELRNYGRTPARILNFSLNALPYGLTEIPPEQPQYNAPLGRGVFLVTNERCSHTASIRISVGADEVIARTKRLAVFGYAEYLDQFGVKHRTGYGRWWDPDRDERPDLMSPEDFAGRTNLLYIEDPGYNYDIDIP